jgi:hypothetical protein
MRLSIRGEALMTRSRPLLAAGRRSYLLQTMHPVFASLW